MHMYLRFWFWFWVIETRCHNSDRMYAALCSTEVLAWILFPPPFEQRVQYNFTRPHQTANCEFPFSPCHLVLSTNEKDAIPKCRGSFL